MSLRGCVSAVCASTKTRLAFASQARPYALRLQSTLTRESPPHFQSPSQPSTSQSPPRTVNPNAPTQGDDDKEKKKPLQNPRNESIKQSFVRLVNPQTGQLDPPARVRDIIKALDRKTQYLELVAEKPEPIVKIINTKERYAKTKEKRVQKFLNRPPEEKELQLTWGVSGGDLQFKLKKAREVLEDGHRVSLVFAPKKGQHVPRPEEQQTIVEETVRLLEDVGKERQERTVNRNIVALFMESTRPRKQVHELEWAYSGDEEWTGLKAVETALQKGTRVEVTFHTPPPPKKGVEASNSSNAIDTATVRQRLESTLDRLMELATEYKPRDTRKTAIVVYLDGHRTA